MNPEAWMAGAALLGSLGFGGGALWVSLVNRPKMSAEAHAATATGETSMSADAREWAQDFREEARDARERAQVAEERANAADERARQADRRAGSAEDRLDALEDKMHQIVAYVGVLQGEVVELGGRPTAPPADLIPPLSPPTPRP